MDLSEIMPKAGLEILFDTSFGVSVNTVNDQIVIIYKAGQNAVLRRVLWDDESLAEFLNKEFIDEAWVLAVKDWNTQTQLYKKSDYYLELTPDEIAKRLGVKGVIIKH